MRLAVYGGSFDPVHRGHLAVADAARRHLRPARLLWVPARQAPHKPGRTPAPAADRVALLERALAGREGEELCLLEVERPGPSYTVDTLEALRASFPDAALTLVMGADSLAHLGTWKDLGRILELAALALAPRPGWGPEALARFRAGLDPGLAARLRASFLPMAEVPVSSTELRELLRA
ncbi:MAG: nicotinate (nicotinamide) nucleotide adenylyltransferase, partial [Nitrospirae bacterium]